VFGAFLTAGTFVAGVCVWWLVRSSRNDDGGDARAIYRPAAILGCLVALAATAGLFFTGDSQGKLMFQQQPMKMASAESLCHSETDPDFSILTVGTHNNCDSVNHLIEVPYVLPFLAEGRFTGVRLDGVKDLQVISGAIVVYSNATVQPLRCTQSLTYTFTIGSPSPPLLPLVDGVAQSPTSPYPNHPVTFTAAAGGGVPPYGFSWDFGDGSTGSGSAVSHTYASSGDYRITLTVQDSALPSPSTRTESWILVVSTPQSSGTYTLSWQGYDWDGGREETITLNGQFLASLPATNTPSNGGARAGV